jgi:ankyrin repeat protein
LEEFRAQLDQLESAAEDQRITAKELSLLHLVCIGVCEQATINYNYNYTHSPITLCFLQQSEKIRLLLERCDGPKENGERRKSLLQQRTRNGFTALHIAIYKAEIDAALTLLEAGADPNAALASGVPPPLHLAAMAGNAEANKSIN